LKQKREDLSVKMEGAFEITSEMINNAKREFSKVSDEIQEFFTNKV
jgi:hypothetical protein